MNTALIATRWVGPGTVVLLRLALGAVVLALSFGYGDGCG